MSDKPNNLARFWQELKRRKVVRVIAMYAATAFILLEVVDIVAPSLGLPSWTLNLVIVLLSVGFPIAVIFSWIFDITPEGVKKTESIEVAKEQEPLLVPVKKRLRVSDLIIAVLVVVVVILAYPEVFKSGTDLKAMTNTTIIVNEYGKEERRQVFKEEYVHKLMILPFQAEATDTINTWLKYGILFGIWEDLLQFQYVLIYSNTEAIHLQEQIKAAKINNCPYFLTGTYRVTDGYYKITSRLHQTKNGSVEKERIYQGNDLFVLFDSISLQTRIDLGVPENIINSFPDLPFEEHTTRNLDAYRYFIFGEYSGKLSTDKYGNYIKAIEQDSTFALASYSYAKLCHIYKRSKISAQKYISHAMRHRQRLPEYCEIDTRAQNYSIFGEREKAIALSEMQHELQPYNIELLNTLINVYNRNFLIAKAEDAIIKLNELVPDYPDYQIMLAGSYLLSDKVDEGLKFIEKRIKENPEYTGFLLIKGQFHLHKNDLDNAEKAFQKAILFSPEDEKDWSLMLDHINFTRNKTLKSDDLQKFAGRYRIDYGEYYIDAFMHNDHLYHKSANQWGSLLYPISDTSFVGFYGFSKRSYCLNKQGKVFKLIVKESMAQDTYICWKQDSLILNAEKLLESNRYQEALIAFQKAYSENPEHYYLANYIKHLEFIQSEEYENNKSILESYIGEYAGFSRSIEILKEKNQFFLKDFKSLDYKLLPLSKDQFMNPSAYSYILEFVKEDNQIMGKAIFNDGSEFFFERTVEQALANQ